MLRDCPGRGSRSGRCPKHHGWKSPRIAGSAWQQRGPRPAVGADKDRHPAEIDKDLRGTARHCIRGDRRAEHLDVPIGRRFRIFADDVNMIEFERRIAHHLPLVAAPAVRLRDDTVGIQRSTAMLPPSDKLSICFAHVAYRLHERFSTIERPITADHHARSGGVCSLTPPLEHDQCGSRRLGVNRGRKGRV
jgi:hypothetical protein